VEATGGPVLPSASRSPPAATEDRQGRGPEGDEGEKDREAQRTAGAAPHTHLPCVTRGRSLTGVKTSWAPDVMGSVMRGRWSAGSTFRVATATLHTKSE